MTSNVGSQHFRKLRNPLGFLLREVSVEQVRADIRREVERRFSPEFLNRIDETVLFSPLTRDEAREIATHYLAQITTTLARTGKTLDVEDDALDVIATQGYSPAAGGRFLKRFIDKRIKLPISLDWHDASHFTVRVHDGEVVTEPAATRLVTADQASACVEVA